MHPEAKLCSFAIAVSLLAVSFSIHASEVTGEIEQITTKTVTVSGNTLSFEPSRAECYDASNQRMACETLVSVGYAQEARVIIENARVVQIHILRLDQ